MTCEALAKLLSFQSLLRVNMVLILFLEQGKTGEALAKLLPFQSLL